MQWQPFWRCCFTQPEAACPWGLGLCLLYTSRGWVLRWRRWQKLWPTGESGQPLCPFHSKMEQFRTRGVTRLLRGHGGWGKVICHQSPQQLFSQHRGSLGLNWSVGYKMEDYQNISWMTHVWDWSKSEVIHNLMKLLHFLLLTANLFKIAAAKLWPKYSHDLRISCRFSKW